MELSKFEGIGDDTRSGDNYAAIRLHESVDITIRNMWVTGFGLTDESNAAVNTYSSLRVTIENNLFTNNGSGIYLKGNPDPTTPVGANGHIVRFNWIEVPDGGFGIHALQNGIGSALAPVLIYQNIVIGGTRALSTIDIAPANGARPEYIKFLNNTVVQPTGDGCFVTIGELKDNAAIEYRNNICYDPAAAPVFASGGASTTSLELDRLTMTRNLYYSAGSSIAFPSAITWANWQGTWLQDANSVENSDPLFVSLGTDDYHLQGGSPALTLGRALHGVGGADNTTIPAGAYITGSETIGLTSGGGGGSSTGPTRLRIRGE